MRFIAPIGLILVASLAFGQATTAKEDPAKQAETQAKHQQEALQKAEDARRLAIQDAEKNGVEVRIKDVARFRGVRANQLQGIGLIVGLAGTGDTKNTPSAKCSRSSAAS